MAIPQVATLTVDITGINGRGVAGIPVDVELENARLVFPMGEPPGTLFPATQHAITDADCLAAFDLLPSTVAGDCWVSPGAFTPTITMPAAYVRLSELPDAS